MKLNKQSVLLLVFTSLLITSFYVVYDPFRIISHVKTVYFKEPNNRLVDLPNRMIVNLDNWEDKHFYNCNDAQTPGYLLYRFPAKNILGAHIYASFASTEGDEYSVAYSLDNKDYKIIEPVRRIQSAYEYVLDFADRRDKPSTLWLKTTLLGRKGWCNLVNYSAEVYSLGGFGKEGEASAGVLVLLFIAVFALAAIVVQIMRFALEKLFLIPPEKSYKLSLRILAVFSLFLLFPLLRALFPVQFHFNRILELYSLPLFYWRMTFLASLFAVIAVTAGFASMDLCGKDNENRIAFCALFLCFFFGAMFFFNNSITGDGGQYFAWLRSFVVDHDLNFKNEVEYMIPAEIGGGVINVIPTRIGTCVAWFPLYALTHFIMGILKHFKLTSFEANGWSLPYLGAAVLTSMSASFAGLVLAYKTLRRYFRFAVALPAAVMIYLGSPLFTWTFVHTCYTHGVDFFIVTLFIYYWSKTLGYRSFRQWFILGTIFFLTVLVREQNILFGLLLIIEAVAEYCRRDREKFEFSEFFRGYAVFLGVFLAWMAVLVLFAFKWGFLGDFLFALKVAKAHTFSGLRSVKTLLFYPTTGFLAATPVVAFSLLGIILAACCYKKYPAKLILMTASVLAVFLIEFGCLSVSFSSELFQFNIGARYLINITLLLMLGFAFLLDSLAKQKWALALVWALAWCAVIHNLSLNVQYQGHIITYLGEGSPLAQIIKQHFNLAYIIIPDVATKYIFWSRPKLVSYFAGLGQDRLFYCIFTAVLVISCAAIFNCIMRKRKS